MVYEGLKKLDVALKPFTYICNNNFFKPSYCYTLQQDNTPAVRGTTFAPDGG